MRRCVALLLIVLALSGAAIATVLATVSGAAGAGASPVNRGGYVAAAYLNPSNPAQLIVVFQSSYSGTVTVTARVNAATGTVTTAVTTGTNTITVPLSSSVTSASVTISVSVNRVL
jgi:ABC-type oligopeptide transport system substrate-binding subunit